MSEITVIDEYMVEIWFRIQKDDDGYPRSKDWEQLLAKPVLERDDHFQIESIPFYLKELSRGDIVEAKVTQNREIGEGEQFEFVSVIQRGGHNTYRLLLKEKRPEDPEFTQNELLKKGLAVEIEDDDFFAVDVPPWLDQEEIDQYLIKEKKRGRWGLQDGYLQST